MASIASIQLRSFSSCLHFDSIESVSKSFHRNVLRLGIKKSFQYCLIEMQWHAVLQSWNIAGVSVLKRGFSTVTVQSSVPVRELVACSMVSVSNIFGCVGHLAKCPQRGVWATEWCHAFYARAGSRLQHLTQCTDLTLYSAIRNGSS